MIKSDITTDADKVYKEFCDFTVKEMKQALTNSLKSSARVLVKDTKALLKASGIKNANKLNPKFNDTLMSGIRYTKVREDSSKELYIKVRIDSNRKHGSGSYRLGILEKGSRGPRYAYKRSNKHKLAYRGTLRSYNFFNLANIAFKSKHDLVMRESFEKAVTKILNKKK